MKLILAICLIGIGLTTAVPKVSHKPWRKHHELEKNVHNERKIIPKEADPAKITPRRRNIPKIVDPLYVGAWNLQKFGPTKSSDTVVMDTIVEVIRRYDIFVVLEVTDADFDAPLALYNALNDGVALEDEYLMKWSDRVGRTSYKEQYVFYWKKSRAELLSTYQYNDTVDDVLAYEPMIAHFRARLAWNIEEFAIIPIHTSPEEAVDELNALADVYDTYVADTGVADAIIIGDFNAGCDYVGEDDYDNIRLYTDSTFTWLIDDHVDTTVRYTGCSYDRIVVTGSLLPDVFLPASVKAVYFDKELELTKEEAYAVSDHYPVQVALRGESTIRDYDFDILQGIVTYIYCESNYILDMATIEAAGTCADPIADCLTEKDVIYLYIAGTSSMESIKDYLLEFSNKYPRVLQLEVYETVRYKLDNHGLKDSSLQELSDDYEFDYIEIYLTCLISDEYCILTVSDYTDLN